MTPANPWWSQIRIPDDLRPYCALSAHDVQTFTQQAAEAADPAAKLQELLIARATEKQQAARRHNLARMTEDKRRIQATDQWPLPWLPVKSQPWITNQDGRMRHGSIEPEDLLTVLVDGDDPKIYASLDELVAYWSVD